MNYSMNDEAVYRTAPATPGLLNILIHNSLKNPAYWRHRISQPMLIEAPIQKKKKIQGFFFFFGEFG